MQGHPALRPSASPSIDGLAERHGLAIEAGRHLRSLDQRLGDRSAAEQLIAAALPHVTGDYAGEHWLASFALLALSAAALKTP